MASTGNRGRFSERLKRLAFWKRNRNLKIDEEPLKMEPNNKLNFTNVEMDHTETVGTLNVVREQEKKESSNLSEEKINDNVEKSIDSDKEENKSYINILKVMAAIPGVIYESTKPEEKKNPAPINDIVFDDSKQNINRKNVVINKKNNQGSYEPRFLINSVKVPSKKPVINDKVVDITDKKTIADDKIVDVSDKKYISNDKNKVKYSGVSKNIDKVNSKESDGNYSFANESKDEREKRILEEEGQLRPAVEELDNKIVDLLSELNNEEKKTDVQNDVQLQELEKKILDKIEKKLVKSINELEILQSELYILKEVNGESIRYEECKEEVEKIKKILEEIEKLKEQYDYLKDNYDFEYLLQMDDEELIDRIIEFRDSFGKEGIQTVIDDYKLLDAYKYLYYKIDDIEEKTNEFEEEKQKELEKLEERDVKFDELVNNVYDVESVCGKYEFFVKEQNEYLKKLDENVSKIDSFEVVNYRLKGLGELFSNSMKYLGLFLLSPLNGLIPAIATEALITRQVIGNLRRNVRWEEERHMTYKAEDLSNSISNAYENLDSMGNTIDGALKTIEQFKSDYKDKFKEYENDILEYRDTFHKIGEIEHRMVNNKIKVEILKKKALQQKELNSKKMRKLTELNAQQNL